ncbi:unnamed protein product [Rotaria sordida]|uniref:Peptidase S1 domain-containing protein n=1 Tax=Rotaria sordida TaxID=392033 RepID=A0A819DNU9_9BILA|nr:unnamed protein product [Rotaria sordida]CAF3833252.1 unnamed protein product [Rotaria sordida]
MIVLLNFHSSIENSPCSGSILNNYFILTAAHCIEKIAPLYITIKAGIHYPIDENATIHIVDRIYLHPKYKGHTDGYVNDIALLKLNKPLNFNDNLYVTPTCIPTINASRNISQYPKNGTRLTVIGWNSIRQGKVDIFNPLQQREIFVIDNNNPMCLRSFIDPEKQFCTGFLKDGRDPCYGDSGGPILQWMSNRWEQVGIASYSRCGIPGYPSIYTRLAYYIDWINSIIISHNESLYTVTTRNSPVTYNCDRNNVTCGCGYANVEIIQSRIIGGTNAVEASWTMFVSLRILNGNKHLCGGTLLSNSYILTAAHCVQSFSLIDPFDLTIVAGITNRSDSSQYISYIRRIYIHPNFTHQSNRFINDIAILELYDPLLIDSNPLLSRTCVPHISSSILNNQYPINGTRLVIIGWGTIEHEQYIEPDILQQLEIFVIDNNHPMCSNLINNIESQFCAGVYQERKGPCQGDSGGAILQWTGQYWQQIGIISSDFTCENSSIPNIYTRLSYYRSWMDEIVSKTGEHLEPTHTMSNTTTITTTISSSWYYTNSTQTSIETTPNMNCSLKYQLNMILFKIILFIIFILIN